jgi:hypothetical protein
MGAFGLPGVRRPAENRTLAPAGRGQGPWSEPDGGPTVTGSGLYRQTEMITMAVAAILLAVGFTALIVLGLILVVGVGWFIMSSL